MKPVLLFDFDGTIADSSEGVFSGVLHALTVMGRPLPDGPTLRKFIGPPLMESFQVQSGLTKDEATQALTLYREEYAVTGLKKCRIYDGIETLLRRLKDDGFSLAVATSKPEPYTRTILHNLGIDDVFTFIAGAEFAGTRTDKPAVIAYALESLGVSPADALMIGDRHHDVDGAHAFGMKCVGILWGFGSREEFASCGADFVCADTEELYSLLRTLS